MKTANRAGLADIFGVSLPTIDGWIRRGCPFVDKPSKDNKSWKFNVPDVANWREEQAIIKIMDTSDVDELKRRKLLAETTIAEINAAKEKNLVVDAEEVKLKLSSIFAEFTSRVRRVPERAVLRIVSESNESKIKSVLLEEIDECLNLFADYLCTE